MTHDILYDGAGRPNQSPRAVAVKPVAPYVGGKALLAKEIIRRIEAIPHTTYAEPFVGVFLRRTQPAKVEVINDINRDVWCLFRVLQEHYAYFIDYLKFRLASRAEFERLQKGAANQKRPTRCGPPEKDGQNPSFFGAFGSLKPTAQRSKTIRRATLTPS